MTELLNNAGFVALMGTVFGGAGLKIIEHWLGKAQERSTEAQSIRDELRKQIDYLRAEITASEARERELEAQVDSWRSKYYDLRDEKQTILGDLQIALSRLKDYERKLDSDKSV